MSGIPCPLPRVYFLDSLQNTHVPPKSRLIVQGHTHTKRHTDRHVHVVSSSEGKEKVSLALRNLRNDNQPFA